MREKARDMLLAKDEDVGELFTEPDAYPLQWTLRWLCGDLRSDVSSNSMGPFAQQWVSQLAGTPTLKADAGVVAGIECYDVARSDGQFYSEALKAALAYQFRQLYQFCDVPTPTLLFDLLVNQLAFPLHYSTGSIRRWRYKAKQTTMFMDLVLFDECRYVYDWMPTIDLAGEGFSDVEQQLAYRFALDGLAKNRRWYNSEFFYGAAVVDQRLEGFEAKHLATRVEIP